MKLKKNISPHGRVTAVSMMKDEAPYLIEWFAHHLAVGFTDILVYTNDCTDGTDEMLMRLEELGLGHHRASVIPEGVKPQPAAIKQAQLEVVVQQSDWVMLFDADEFLSINYGDGKIDSMISAAGNANGIVITWRIFGSAGVQDWSRQPVTEQYTQAAPRLWNKGWGVKTLFKFDPDYWKLGIHRPSMKSKHLKTDFPNKVNWLNGSGLPMEDYFKFRGWRSIRRTIGYDWAQLNHYAVKSIDAYAVRKFRGNVNLKKDKYNDEYWSLQDRNEAHDTSVLRYSAERARIADELLKDPILYKLHNESLERLEMQLAEFKQTDAYSSLKESLIKASKVPITQVSAKPPKARDPAKIAALMSEVEIKSAERPKSKRRNKSATGFDADPQNCFVYLPEPIDRTTDISFEKISNHGVLLPADPRIFGPAALSEILSGKFDRRNARLRGSLIGPNDRLLELGAGVCFLPILSAQLFPNLAVLAHEERPELAEIGRDLAKENGVRADVLQIVDGRLLASTKDDGSNSCFITMLEDFLPTILVVNNSLVTPKMLSEIKVQSLRRIVVPADRSGQQIYIDALSKAGFTPSSMRNGGLVFDIAVS